MIIGLSGKKRVGKDTVADYLVNDHGFIKYSFADPIKEVSRILFNFTEEQLYGDDKEKIDPTWKIKPRDFFQKFGTDYMQYQFPKEFPESNSVVPEKCFWVKCFHSWYLKQREVDPDVKIVITDVRFIHEYDFLIKEDAMIIKIENNNIQNTDSHISENDLNSFDSSKFDYCIKNDSSLDSLHNKINEVIKYEQI